MPTNTPKPSERKKKRQALVTQATAYEICREVAEELGVEAVKLRELLHEVGFGRLPDKVGKSYWWKSAELEAALRKRFAPPPPVTAEPPQRNTAVDVAILKLHRIEQFLQLICDELGINWKEAIDGEGN